MTHSLYSAIARQAASSREWNAQAWSPARVYLLISGVYLVFIGAVGFIYSSSFAIGADAEESSHIFGIFETNGWHNLAGLLGGLGALAFALRPETTRLGALLLGVAYIVITVALAIWEPSTFSIASNGADQVVHALLAVGGVASAFATRSAANSHAPG